MAGVMGDAGRPSPRPRRRRQRRRASRRFDRRGGSDGAASGSRLGAGPRRMAREGAGGPDVRAQPGGRRRKMARARQRRYGRLRSHPGRARGPRWVCWATGPRSISESNAECTCDSDFIVHWCDSLSQPAAAAAFWKCLLSKFLPGTPQSRRSKVMLAVPRFLPKMRTQASPYA